MADVATMSVPRPMDAAASLDTRGGDDAIVSHGRTNLTPTAGAGHVDASDFKTESVPGEGAGSETESKTPVDYMWDLSGVWMVDPNKSDSIEPFLTGLGLSWAQRRIAMKITSTTTIEHTSSAFKLIMSSSLGSKTDVHPINNQYRDVIAEDGTPCKLLCSVVDGGIQLVNEMPSKNMTVISWRKLDIEGRTHVERLVLKITGQPDIVINQVFTKQNVQGDEVVKVIPVLSESIGTSFIPTSASAAPATHAAGDGQAVTSSRGLQSPRPTAKIKPKEPWQIAQDWVLVNGAAYLNRLRAGLATNDGSNNMKFVLVILLLGWLIGQSMLCCYLFLLALGLFMNASVAKPGTPRRATRAPVSARAVADEHARRVAEPWHAANVEPPQVIKPLSPVLAPVTAVANNTQDPEPEAYAAEAEADAPDVDAREQQLSQLRPVPGADTDVTYNGWGKIFHRDLDVTNGLKIPLCAPQRAEPKGAVVKGCNHVFYCDVDGDVCHLFEVETSGVKVWRHENLTLDVANAGRSSHGGLSVLCENNRLHVYYVGPSGRVFELLYWGRWTHQNLFDGFQPAPGQAAAVLGPCFNDTLHLGLVYKGSDGANYKLYYTLFKGWRCQAVTAGSS